MHPALFMVWVRVGQSRGVYLSPGTQAQGDLGPCFGNPLYSHSLSIATFAGAWGTCTHAGSTARRNGASTGGGEEKNNTHNKKNTQQEKQTQAANQAEHATTKIKNRNKNKKTRTDAKDATKQNTRTSLFCQHPRQWRTFIRREKRKHFRHVAYRWEHLEQEGAVRVPKRAPFLYFFVFFCGR